MLICQALRRIIEAQGNKTTRLLGLGGGVPRQAFLPIWRQLDLGVLDTVYYMRYSTMVVFKYCTQGG